MLSLINAKYSLPTWLWVMMSGFFAVLVAVLTFTDPELAQPFVRELPFNGWLWTPLTILGSLMVMVGMALDRVTILRAGTFLSFLMWIFGGISFGAQPDGRFNVILIIIPILLVHAYIYLASYYREIPRL